MPESTAPTRSAIASLRRFVGDRDAVEGRCELCARLISPGHRHLMEAATRRLICSCDPCALLFAGHPGGRYRGLPRGTLRIAGFRMAEATWGALGIPVNMAYFSKRADGGVIAHFPSPAGATESAVPPDDWTELEEANPILRNLSPDVEALLVNRVGASRDHYLVPIDVALRLAGLIRTHWRGLAGGAEAWEEIGQFFDRLRVTSREATHA